MMPADKAEMALNDHLNFISISYCIRCNIIHVYVCKIASTYTSVHLLNSLLSIFFVVFCSSDDVVHQMYIMLGKSIF